MFIVDKRKAAIGKLLLENGANPNQGCILSQILSDSRPDHCKSLMKDLLDYGANPDLFIGQRPNIIQAVKNTDKEVVLQLLEKGVNVNAMDGEKTHVYTGQYHQVMILNTIGLYCVFRI